MNTQEDFKLLIVKYLTNEATRSDMLSLVKWLETDSRNETYFNEMKAAWALSGKTDTQVFDADGSWQKISKGMHESRDNISTKFSLAGLLKSAALWALLFGLGSLFTWFVIRKPTLADASHITEIAAPLGAKSNVTLPDGTKVWLNAGTKITYNTGFDQKDRVVFLTGEAFFHVKTNPNKPFIVKTSDLMVRALGTKFNVKAYPDERTITATLEEGKIDIQMNDATTDQPKIVLRPNENIVFVRGSKQKSAPEKTLEKPETKKVTVAEDKLELHQNVRTELYTSWKEERWIIEGEPLSSLVPKLERRFNMKIVFTSSDLKKYKFTGTIQNETVEQIMKAMCFTAPLNFTIVKDTITLSLNQQLKEKFTKVITQKN